MHAQAAQSAVGELEVLRLEGEARQADEARVGRSEDFRSRHGAFGLFIKEV
jgi:hypothetical protein